MWSMRGVKGFVVLAIVLLIPTMAYFHKMHFVRVLQPELRDTVMEILHEEGVEDPGVRMDLLDAFITGRLPTDEQREMVAARVDALPAVRVPVGGNQLHTYGWIRIARMDGLVRVEGVVTPGYSLDLPVGLAASADWDAGLERRETVEVPDGAERWLEFLGYYFTDAGNREVELREGGLILRGDATVLLRSDWLSKASEVVEKDAVVDRLTVQPSRFHFPGYEPESLADPLKLAQVRRQLAANTIAFGGTAEVTPPDGEADKIAALAQAIQDAGGSARYAVGGHPGREGNITDNGQVARARAREVVAALVSAGVDEGQLEVVSFGVTESEQWDNHVEVVVK